MSAYRTSPRGSGLSLADAKQRPAPWHRKVRRAWRRSDPADLRFRHRTVFFFILAVLTIALIPFVTIHVLWPIVSVISALINVVRDVRKHTEEQMLFFKHARGFRHDGKRFECNRCRALFLTRGLGQAHARDCERCAR